MRPAKVREFIADRLIGQEHVIDALLPPIIRWEAGMHWDDRPAGVYLLLGPTGTGKTLTVELLAEGMHGSRMNLTRINCAEYAMEHEIAKLIGAPPGYLGHKETNPVITQQKLLAKASPESALSIILFDEIEKGSQALYNLMLGILDKGELRTGDAQLVSFQKTLVFMTSNLGTRELASRNFTFDKKPPKAGEREGIAHNAANRHFAPEFLNRVDETLVYKPLEINDLRLILKGFAARSNTNLDKVDGNGRLKLALSDEAADWLIARGYSPAHGARELRRVWDKQVLYPLSHFVSSCAGTSRGWGSLRIVVAGDRLEFHPMTLKESIEETLRLVPSPVPERSIFGRVRKAGGKRDEPGF